MPGIYKQLILNNGRYLQAGGAQGVLPSVFGIVNKKWKTPAFSLGFVFLSSALFILIGDIATLINSASFTRYDLFNVDNLQKNVQKLQSLLNLNQIQ